MDIPSNAAEIEEMYGPNRLIKDECDNWYAIPEKLQAKFVEWRQALVAGLDYEHWSICIFLTGRINNIWNFRFTDGYETSDNRAERSEDGEGEDWSSSGSRFPFGRS